MMKPNKGGLQLLAIALACLLTHAIARSKVGLDIPESFLSDPDVDQNEAMVLEVREGISADPAGIVGLQLRDVQVHLLADAALSATTEHLHFRAPGSDIQAQFKFPLPPQAAVYRFEASLGDRIIKTEVQEKAEAKATYEGAVQQGHSAIHMEQAPKSNMYIVNLGNLAANEACVVRISYIQVLSSVASTLEWTHTSTWVPPYTGSQRDAVNMDEIKQTTPSIQNKVSYQLAYEVCISSEANIKSVDSLEKIQVLGGDNTKGDGCQRVVKLSSEVSDPGRDFSLLVEVDSSTEPSVALQRTQRDGSTKMVGLASFPFTSTDASQADSGSAKPPSQASDDGPLGKLDWIFQAFSHSRGEASGRSQTAQPQAAQPQAAQLKQPQAAQLKQELYLVGDCSGSMFGEPQWFAHEAALYFVRDLPLSAGVKFQVMCFGSRFIKMQPDSQDYNEETEKMAVSWINKKLLKDLGGTEMLNVLQHIYEQPIPEDYERQIIFMTDGGVSGPEERYITSLVAESPQAPRTTLHTLGIGYGVHRSFLEDMAQLTGGVTQYVQSSKDITKSCSFLRQCALSAGMLVEPKLTAKSCELKTVPLKLPPRLFEGQTLHVLFEVNHANPGASLELNAVRKDGTPVHMTVPIPSNEGENGMSMKGALRVVKGDELAALHAMAYIGSLLRGESALPKDTVKQQVIHLAKQEHLVTPYTSAVGVLLRKDPLDPSGTQKIEVPLKMPQGRALWGTYQASSSSVPPQGSAMGPPPMGPPASPPPPSPPPPSPLPPPPSPAPPSKYEAPQPSPLLNPPPQNQVPTPDLLPPPQKQMPDLHQQSPLLPPTPVHPPLQNQKLSSQDLPADSMIGRELLSRCTSILQRVSQRTAAAYYKVARRLQNIPSLLQRNQSSLSTCGNDDLASAPEAIPAACSLSPEQQKVLLSLSPEVLQALSALTPEQLSILASMPAASLQALAQLSPKQLQAACTGASSSSSPEQQQVLQAPPLCGAHYDDNSNVMSTATVSSIPGSSVPTSPPSSEPKQNVAVRPPPPPPVSTSPKEAAGEAPAGEAPPSAPQGASRCPADLWSGLTGREILNRLNLARTTEGLWKADEELVKQLVVPKAKKAHISTCELASQVMASKAAEISEDAWTSVLSLAYLKKYLGGDYDLWAGMEQKAFAWMAAVWPQGVQSIGHMVLLAMKLL